MQFNSTQKVCSLECAIEFSKLKKQREILKDWSKRKKLLKAKLETPSQTRNKLQKVFNHWVRLRDKKDNCISCGKKAKNYHAGHLYSVGRFPELRFNPDNCHKQCEHCNVFLHGNGNKYRINLEKKIGKEKLIKLDQKAGKPVKLLKHEVKEHIEYYTYLIKKLK